MFRLLLTILFFALSLLNLFPVPSKEVWYAGILIPEYPWIFILVMILLIVWNCYRTKYRPLSLLLSILALVIFCSPIVRAYIVASDLKNKLQFSFGIQDTELAGIHQEKPFSFWQMFTGNGAKKIPFTTYHYAMNGGVDLTFNFSHSALPGIRPCLLVVHGGSWKRGDNSEIAAVNNYFANTGYQVATINYRLAPRFHSPAPQEDVHSAFVWLRKHATELKIDINNFVLLGRSAGGQIVLTSAYTGNEPGLKGVVAFYGPSDMFWSYDHYDNPLIMDSRMVQRDFLGGSPGEVRDRYMAESPIFHITAATVPTLLVHGQLDAHVYYEQSVRLAKKLDEFKVKNMLLTLPWATHGCEYNLNGPSGQLSIYCVERFLSAVTQKSM